MAAVRTGGGALSLRPAPWVVYERLDDEYMIIHLETGAYFALEGAAAECWEAVLDGSGVDEAVDLVTGRYDVSPASAEPDIGAFFDELKAERLILAADDAATPSASADRVPAELSKRRPYKAPVLEKYDDLEELLLFDPIHEVDEAGWPVIDGRSTE